MRLETREARDALLEYTNQREVMTRPIWRLMTELPMYQHCHHDGLATSRWLEGRIVNLPSSVPLGEILEEYLESAGMSQAELAQRTGLAAKTVNQIIQGKAPLTQNTALRLERVLGRPAHFWNQLEVEHQEALARARVAEAEREQLEWMKRFPIKKDEGAGLDQHPKGHAGAAR